MTSHEMPKNESKYLACANFKTLSPKETREIVEKIGKIQKKPYIFLTRYCHGNDLKKVNNNTNMIARMLLILLENFVNISHRGKN